MVGFHWGSSVHRFLGDVFPRFPPSKLQNWDIENGVSQFEQMNIENHSVDTKEFLLFHWIPSYCVSNILYATHVITCSSLKPTWLYHRHHCMICLKIWIRWKEINHFEALDLSIALVVSVTPGVIHRGWKIRSQKIWSFSLGMFHCPALMRLYAYV